MHIFKYSKRKGTKAAVMPDQVPEQVKTERSKVLLALAQKMSEEFREYYVGRPEEILLEETGEIGEMYILPDIPKNIKDSSAGGRRGRKYFGKVSDRTESGCIPDGKY